MVLVAFGCWLPICAFMLVALGEQLDMDSVFPDFVQHAGTTVSHGPTPANPPPAVVAAFAAVGMVVGLPAVLPGRAFAVALRASTIAVGICLAVSVLRLGLLLTPVLGLQALALHRLARAENL